MKDPSTGTLIIFALFIALMVMVSDASAGEHKLYLGLGWTHLSNLEAGSPFNDDPEDNADHVAIEAEYQWVQPDDDYLFVMVSAGKSKFNAQDGSQNGWNCSGCSINNMIRVGYRWRVM